MEREWMAGSQLLLIFRERRLGKGSDPSRNAGCTEQDTRDLVQMRSF